MATVHRVVFGDCRTMKEIPDQSIQLTITSPPYYNAPFDYPDLFSDYNEFLTLIQDVCRDLYRVSAAGRIVCFVTDDMLVKGQKYPVVADITRLMLQAGFRYRDRIVWNITNVLPLGPRLEKGIAAFPEEIPKRLIKLFSFHGETVLDPFLGSGTTMKVAQELGRNSWGYEIDRGLKKIIAQKLDSGHRSDSKVEFRFRQERRKSRPTVPRKQLTVHSS